MTKYCVCCHEQYKSGSPSSTGGLLELFDSWEKAEEFIQQCVDEDVYGLENEMGRGAIPNRDFFDTMNPLQSDRADCYRHTDIGNSEVFYYIDPIEL